MYETDLYTCYHKNSESFDFLIFFDYLLDCVAKL